MDTLTDLLRLSQGGAVQARVGNGDEAFFGAFTNGLFTGEPSNSDEDHPGGTHVHRESEVE